MSRKSTMLLALAAAALTPNNSFAQLKDPTESIGRFAFDTFSGFTHGVQSTRAFVATPTTVADTGTRSILPMLGFAGTYWLTRSIGVFGDMSGVDMLTSTASVGPIKSEASGWIINYHGGVQVQHPGRRWRPYASFGIGGANISSNLKLTEGSRSMTANPSVNAMSYTYGGGIRTMFNDRVGMRFGYEGVTVGKNFGNFGRVLIGLTLQTRPN